MQKKGDFTCFNCSGSFSFSKLIGTKHRNHCPFCLWSKHVDFKISGDRKAKCSAEMKPIGLTFKHEGVNKYGKIRQGEIMLIHECVKCGKISINRIAGDDNPKMILQVFEESQQLPSEEISQLECNGLKVLSGKNKREIITQLFGKHF